MFEFDRYQYKVVSATYNLMANLVQEETTKGKDHLTAIVRFEKIHRGTRLAKWIVVKHMLEGMKSAYESESDCLEELSGISTGCQLATLLGYKIGSQSKGKGVDIDDLIGYAHGFDELTNTLENMK